MFVTYLLILIQGTFLPYDTVNKISHPMIYGFQGGVHFKDNLTKEYVGYGGPCSNGENPVPGYIDVNQTKPGCFIECNPEMYDNQGIYYLLYHPDLAYVPTDINTTQNIPGVLKLTASQTYLYGRVKYLGAYHLGKVVTVASALGLYIDGSSGSFIKYTTGFEVLACSNNSLQPAKVCSSVYNVTSGNVVYKKACRITIGMDFEAADAYCKANGMAGLYTISNQIDQSALIDFVTKVFGAISYGAKLHVNGQQAANGTWFNPNGMPLYSGAIPTSGSGGFLNVEGFGTSGWATKSYGKTNGANTVCEFDVLKVPLTSICNGIANITDSNGQLSKRACFMCVNVNSSTRVDICRSYNMQGLYAISTLEHYNQLNTFLSDRMMAILGFIGNTKVHVDGIQAANGTWFNYNPNPTLVYSGAIPQSGSGEFLGMNGTSSGFVPTSFSSSTQPYWVVCEYDVV